jgi:hypothetical protein
MKKSLLPLLAAFVLGVGASPALAGSQDFTLVNGSASTICYVYISPSGSDSWEEDVLGADDCLDPGGSMNVRFSGGDQAMWDLRIEDNDGNYEDYRDFNLNQISTITIKGGGEAGYK